MAFQQTEADNSIANSLLMRQKGASISPKDIQAGLDPYGLKIASTVGKTDQQLYNTARDSVIKWYHKQHPSGAAKAYQDALAAYQAGKGGNPGSFSTFVAHGNKATGPMLQLAAAAPSSGASSGGASGGGATSASGGTSSASTSSGSTSTPPPSTTSTSGTSDVAAARARLAAAQAPALLAAAGLTGVTVPSYAMTSLTNLKAWIDQTVAARQRQARSGGFHAN